MISCITTNTVAKGSSRKVQPLTFHEARSLLSVLEPEGRRNHRLTKARSRRPATPVQGLRTSPISTRSAAAPERSTTATGKTTRRPYSIAPSPPPPRRRRQKPILELLGPNLPASKKWIVSRTSRRPEGRRRRGRPPPPLIILVSTRSDSGRSWTHRRHFCYLSRCRRCCCLSRRQRRSWHKTPVRGYQDIMCVGVSKLSRPGR